MTVEVRREGHVATVVLNRPDKLNSLTAPMWRGLVTTFKELDADASGWLAPTRVRTSPRASLPSPAGGVRTSPGRRPNARTLAAGDLRRLSLSKL